MSPIILPPRSPSPQPLSGMTLAAAHNELAARGFDYLPAGRMTIMLNDAKNSFEDTWEFPWLQRTTTGPAPLELLDLKYILTVKTGDSSELLSIDIRQLAQGATDLTAAGAPGYWYLAGDVDDRATLNVWPSAGTTLTVFYIAHSPELADLTDQPLIPARYQSIWIDFAVIQAYQDSDNFISAQALQADVNTRMQAVIERYETINRQHSGFIGQRGFSEDD